MARARSTGFVLCHPLSESVLHYLTLYRNPRFSDHLLARWLIAGASRGAHAGIVGPLLKQPEVISPPYTKTKARGDTAPEGGRRSRRLKLVRKTCPPSASGTIRSHGGGSSPEAIYEDKTPNRELVPTRVQRRSRSTPPPPLALTTAPVVTPSLVIDDPRYRNRRGSL